MITTMNSNTQTTKDLFKKQQITIALIDSRTRQLKKFKDSLKDSIKNRPTWASAVDSTEDELEKKLMGKLQEHNELNIKHCQSLLDGNLKDTLVYAKTASKLLDDFLTDIVIGTNIKTGLLVQYADLTKCNHELHREQLKMFFKTLTGLDKVGQPRYWK